MNEFRVKTFAPDWIEIEQPSTGHAWQFALDRDEDGRRIVSMRSARPVEAAKGDAMDAALDHARGLVVRMGRADG